MAGSNKIKPLKLETTDTNDPLDLLPTETNPAEDNLRAKGLIMGGSEEASIVEDNGVLLLSDQQVTTPVSLRSLTQNSKSPITFYYGANAGAGRVLNFVNGFPSNEIPFIVVSDGRISDATFESTSAATCNIGVFTTTNLTTPLYTLSITNSSVVVVTGLDVAVTAGQQIVVKQIDGSSTKPVVNIYFQIT